MFRIPVLTIVVTLAAGSAAFAQSLPPQPPPVANPMLGQGNEQERAACHPDVMRYCRELIKDNQDDVFSILGCLQTNRERISNACRTVLASHGQ